MIDNEAIYYCTHCGAANKKSAVECTECEKKIATKYRPFYDFLKKHTKEDATGTAVDTVFGFVQNFLLSHVYGIVLSVTIVAAGIATVYADASYIKEVNKPPVQKVQEKTVEIPKPDPGLHDMEFTGDDEYYLLYLMSNYDGHADDKRISERYWEGKHEYVKDPKDIYAQTKIAGYNFGGVHELIDNPVNIQSDTPGHGGSYQGARYVDNTSIVVNENCTTDIAKKIYDAGYRVCEANYVLRIVDRNNYNYDTEIGTVYKELVYRTVFLGDGKKWYIADDRLIKRLNV